MFGTGLAPLALYISAIIVLLLSVFWRPQIGLYFLIPLLPLQTTRYKILDYPLGNKLVFIILLGVILGLLLRGRSLLPPALPLKKLLILFMLFHFVSLWYGAFYLGGPLPLSFDDPRFETWINYMVMPGLYFVVVCAIRDVKQMKILIMLMCLSLLVVDRGFYSTQRGRDLSQYSDRLRDAGPLGYAGTNGLGAFEAAVSTFLLGLYAFEKKKWIKLAILGLLAGNMYCLLFSFSRGGYIGFLAGLVFLGTFKERKLLIVVLALVIGYGALLPTAVRERIAMTYDEDSGSVDSSSEGRLDLWRDAAQLFLENPVIGTGFDTYAYLHRVGGFQDTHNIYLKVLVETGLIGLALFLALLVGIYRLGFRLFRSAQDPFLASVGLGFAAMVVVTFMTNLFGDRWTYLQVSGYLWTWLACVVRGQKIVAEGYGQGEDIAGNLVEEIPDTAASMA